MAANSLARWMFLALAAGEEQVLSLSSLAPGSIDSNLFAKVDEANAVAEALPREQQRHGGRVFRCVRDGSARIRLTSNASR